MFRVIIHQQAKEDISRDANWWTDNHSMDQALSWIDTVEKQLQELSQNPHRFGFADENGLFQYEIRQVLVGLGSRRSYRGLFTIRDDTVHVLTVLRAEQGSIEIQDLRVTF